jgi:hypothetical protein
MERFLGMFRAVGRLFGVFLEYLFGVVLLFVGGRERAGFQGASHISHLFADSSYRSLTAIDLFRELGLS